MYYPPNDGRNPPPWQPLPPQAPPPLPTPNEPARMSTDAARRRAGVLKRWSLGAAVLSFCALSGLVASHVTGVTSAAGASPTATPANQDNNGGFFPGNRHDGEGGGSDDGGGFNFGNGSGGGTFQPPASSSSGS